MVWWLFGHTFPPVVWGRSSKHTFSLFCHLFLRAIMQISMETRYVTVNKKSRTYDTSNLSIYELCQSQWVRSREGAGPLMWGDPWLAYTDRMTLKWGVQVRSWEGTPCDWLRQITWGSTQLSRPPDPSFLFICSLIG